MAVLQTGFTMTLGFIEVHWDDPSNHGSDAAHVPEYTGGESPNLLIHLMHLRGKGRFLGDVIAGVVLEQKRNRTSVLAFHPRMKLRWTPCSEAIRVIVFSSRNTSWTIGASKGHVSCFFSP